MVSPHDTETRNGIAHHVLIRPATPSDRPALESIAAQTWDGNDYLPYLLDEWLADTDGQLYVAVDSLDRAVGVSKLTRFGAGEWWLEGIRVDPAHRGKGIARALHQYGLQLAEARHRASGEREGTIRLCTDIGNQAVHHLSESLGFSLIAQFWRYGANPLPNFPSAAAFRPMTPTDLPAVRAFLDSSPHYQNVARCTIESRWVCRTLTDNRIAAYVEHGAAYIWHGFHHDPSRVDGLVIGVNGPVYVTPDSPIEFNLYYLDALPGSFARIAQAVRGLAATLGVARLRHMTLARPERLVAIEQAGWRRGNDDSGKACLFSRPLSASISFTL